jgi:hypothetical protein
MISGSSYASARMICRHSPAITGSIFENFMACFSNMNHVNEEQAHGYYRAVACTSRIQSQDVTSADETKMIEKAQ